MNKFAEQTLEVLAQIICGDSYTGIRKSGPQLVMFFNCLGFNDKYGQGFPSRIDYTRNKLKLINGTPAMDCCLRKTFDVRSYIDNLSTLNQIITDFNQQAEFDGLHISRNDAVLIFEKPNGISALRNYTDKSKEDFLAIEYEKINFYQLAIDGPMICILEERFKEIQACLNSAPLAAILLIGSSLEGILLSHAFKHNEKLFHLKSTPKNTKTGEMKQLTDWKLAELIDCFYEAGLIGADIKKFSHAVRDFRNYIHPQEQLYNNFQPTQDTAKICFQVLKACIHQLSIT